MTDLPYYHMVQEQLEKMLEFFKFLELEEIPHCTFYHYEIGACEEYCRHPEITRSRDFDSKQECWSCNFRKVTRHE